MKISQKISILASFLLLSACQSPPPSGVKVEIKRVVSGQTLEVLVLDGASTPVERVRLLGISAPDLGQYPWGEAAKDKLQQLVSDRQGRLQSVLLESGVEEKDRFGRRLAYLWHEGKLVNEQLVAQGHALADLNWSDSKYRQRLVRAQEYARLMGQGIWDPKQPMRLTPAEFRSNHPR